MHGDADVRRWVLVAAAAAILVVLLTAGVAHYVGGGGPGDQTVDTIRTVEPIENGSELWPYTSRAADFRGRTLAINVIAIGPGEHVRAEFRRQVEANWTTRSIDGPGNATAAGNGTVANVTERVLEIVDEEVVWLPAEGATRYTYVRSVEGAGQWLTESYQLYDGTYLGTRHHVRAYRSPSDPWTAMQAHREYWDWFRLRHTVTSIRDTQQYVDAQFLDDRRVEGVYRVHLDNGASQDGDGWATVIEFAAVVGLTLGVGRDWRLDRLLDRSRTWLASDDAGSVVRVGVLVVAMAGIYLAVRVGGVALERQFGGVSPKLIAAALYPVLALGLPVAAYVLSRDLEAEDAFAGAVVGLVAGFVVEYGYLGLEVIPVSLLLHRVALVLALGLIAAAGALSSLAVAGWTRLLGLGVAGWVVALGLPLLGVV